MDWLFWPGATLFGMIFVSACLNQKSTWVKLWQVGMGLIMLCLVLLWPPFWWPVRLTESAEEAAFMFWAYLMYFIVMFALLLPGVRSDT